MESITSLNKKFCEGADELRYIWKVGTLHGSEMRFSKNKAPHPKKGSWLRSTKYADENAYLLVFDVDSNGLTDELLEGVRGLYSTVRNYLHVEPVLKASGSKGAQIIFKLKFNENIDEHLCLEHLRNLAYTTWKLCTPKVRKRIKFNEKPGVDCAMFRKRQMLRSFCKHLGSGKFSVPFEYDDTLEIIEQKMNLEKPIKEFVGFPTLEFNEDLIIYKYDKNPLSLGPVLENLPDVKASKETTTDQIYKRMPNVIKRIVSSDTTPHDLKWSLIVYLRMFERLTKTEIVDWLFKYCDWKELSNLKMTNYHVEWTCNWCDKKALKTVSKLESGELQYKYANNRFPLPKEIMTELIDEKLSKHNIPTVFHYLVRIWSRYLVAFVVEPSSKSRISR